MFRCPSCDCPLSARRERLGARCPRCRGPLYEPPGVRGRPAREGQPVCAAHNGSQAEDVCARCRHHLCLVCRTSWRGQVLCPACTERALETSPEHLRAQRAQVLHSLALGGGAWLLGALALGGMKMGESGRLEFLILLLLLGLFLFLFAGLLALAGLGKEAVALRRRGPHPVLAGAGLLLNGLYLGCLLGLFVFTVWQL